MTAAAADETASVRLMMSHAALSFTTPRWVSDFAHYTHIMLYHSDITAIYVHAEMTTGSDILLVYE